MRESNPILLEVYRNRLEGIAEEMGAVLQKTAFSANIKERLDFSCALFDAAGKMVAQAAHIPVHLGAMPASVRSALAAFPRWMPGDVVILNDPYAGGTHLPDLTMVSPVFAENLPSPSFFVASRAHHSDVGGMSPGSLPLSSELFQEGLILPPVQLKAGGVINEALISVILRNVRTPTERKGDLSAQMAANEAGVLRLGQLTDRHGLAELSAYCNHLQQYSERRTRAMIESWSDGEAEFVDGLDIDLKEASTQAIIRVRVRITGDDILFDFSDSEKSGPHGFNAVLPIAKSACYYVVRCLSTDDIPVNDGCFRPVSIVAPAGSIVNAEFPSAVAVGNVETSQRIVDTVLGALAALVPDLAPAASQGTMNNVMMGPADICSDEPWVYYETIGGGAGAGPSGSGQSGLHTHMTNTMNTPVEAFEQAYPIRITHYGIREGSGGHAQFSGGDGVIREYAFETSTRVTVQSTRRNTPPWGLKGGASGECGRNTWISRDGTEHNLPGQFSRIFSSGERLRIETPGGGGWGRIRE